MFAKILIGSGILIMFTSIIGVVGGIFGSFEALKSSESAGIGAVGDGIQFALVSNILFFVGILVLLFGCIKLYRDKRASK